MVVYLEPEQSPVRMREGRSGRAGDRDGGRRMTRGSLMSWSREVRCGECRVRREGIRAREEEEEVRVNRQGVQGQV